MRCINTTGCLTAYRHEEIHPKPGAPSVCPECGTRLSATPLHQGAPGKIVAAVVLVAALGAAAYFGRPYVANLLKSQPKSVAAATPSPDEKASPSIARANPTPAATPVSAARRAAPTPARPIATLDRGAATPAPIARSEPPTPRPTPPEAVASVAEPPRREPVSDADAASSPSTEPAATPRIRVKVEWDQNTVRLGGETKELHVVHLPPLAAPVAIGRDASYRDAAPQPRPRLVSPTPPPEAKPRARIKLDSDHTPIRLDN